MCFIQDSGVGKLTFLTLNNLMYLLFPLVALGLYLRTCRVDNYLINITRRLIIYIYLLNNGKYK